MKKISFPAPSSQISHYRFWAYLQLMRPANIVTAWADVLAGFAISESVISSHEIYTGVTVANFIPLLWLLLSTTGLYSGSIVFNDVFDAEIDAKERPDRPIPSGKASYSKAALLGSVLLAIGVLAAVQVSWLSATLASSIAAAAIIYDAYGKHHPIFGSLNMGICRGGNLLLGVSVVSPMVAEYWFLALIPIVYIAAITTLSRHEVRGGDSNNTVIALLLVSTVIAALLGLGLLNKHHVLAVLPFILLLALRVLIPFINAMRQPTPENIQIAVKAGVLSLIVVDATAAATFASLPYGILVLSLLPISMGLAQIFSVT
jgi:4-hydroxybenzoate polyprenyltransferase